MFDHDKAFYPFNEYKLLLSTMLAKNGITYEEIYISARNIFNIAPTLGFSRFHRQEPLVRSKREYTIQA